MRMSVTLAGLFVVFLTAVKANSNNPVYKAVDDKVVLKPDSVVKPITSIVWKHGPDIAMQWNGNETHTYRHFKVRGSLNSTTGALMITGLTRNDSGNYTVEINNQVKSTIQLLVISHVSKPTVSTWCDPEMTYCVLTCSGNTTDAEPITFKWEAGDMRWSSSNVHIINKDDQVEPWYACLLDNPVSFKASDPAVNPFHRKNRTFMLTCLILVEIVVVCILILLIYKCK
ncbi:uncharacterized protein LOC127378676 [Dicentrarchus labrax]|uniref:uncharacterized protein LOC127378676 n=1 Tax=Dicentrarchus labrax TaxID=13489 RepID=UPI0021F59B9E|nr:uncharacterized protein LOC127378676 [Dicentrarchus labrax]